jgi:hypothetical protein
VSVLQANSDLVWNPPTPIESGGDTDGAGGKEDVTGQGNRPRFRRSIPVKVHYYAVIVRVHYVDSRSPVAPNCV